MRAATWILLGDWSTIDAGHVLLWVVLVVVGMLAFLWAVGGTRSSQAPAEDQVVGQSTRLLWT